MILHLHHYAVTFCQFNDVGEMVNCYSFVTYSSNPDKAQHKCIKRFTKSFRQEHGKKYFPCIEDFTIICEVI